MQTHWRIRHLRDLNPMETVPDQGLAKNQEKMFDLCFACASNPGMDLCLECIGNPCRPQIPENYATNG